MKAEEIRANAQKVIWESHGQQVLINGSGPYLAIPEEDDMQFEPVVGSSFLLTFQGDSGAIAFAGDEITFVESGDRVACIAASYRSNYRIIVPYEPTGS